MKHASIALALALLASFGCRRPEAAPTFDQRLSVAVGAGEKAVSEEDREAYRQGFENGARMVEAAVAAHRRPYMLRVGTNSGSLLPKQQLPDGITVLDDAPPEVELDAATGLEIIRFAPTKMRGFTQGQVEGFQWAFEKRRAELAKPRPEPPFPSQWELVTDASHTKVVNEQGGVSLTWTPGILAWSRSERGFPSQRMWRPAPEWMKPKAVATVKDALWIDTERGALALDLESGVIRSVKPRPAPAVMEDANWQKTPAEQQAAIDKARPEWVARAAKGDTEAMLELAWVTEDPVERYQWFRKAGDSGDPKGMYEVAVRCFQGSGVPEDKVKAKRWFEKAAAQGHPGAKEALEGLFP